MSTHDQLAETQGILEGVVSKWSPSTDEQFDIRMMRALLQLNAYEQDVARVNRGEPPIRTSYPIPLPCTKQGAALELLEALEGLVIHAENSREDDPMRDKWIDRARAAIAKAKGGGMRLNRTNLWTASLAAIAAMTQAPTRTAAPSVDDLVRSLYPPESNPKPRTPWASDEEKIRRAKEKRARKAAK